MKRGVRMEEVNRGKNAEGGGARGQIRGRIDFRNPMQPRFPGLRMKSQYARETAPFAGTHD